MVYVVANRSCFQFYDQFRNLLFNADKDHNCLFEYIAKDLSDLPVLFEQYVWTQMDINTLELKHQNSENAEILNKIKEFLASAHPYYKQDCEHTIIKAIGRYFNDLLLHLKLNTRNLCSVDVTDKWYAERIRRLLRPLAQYPEDYSGEFYAAYQKKMQEGPFSIEDVEETFIMDVPQHRPVGFSSEIWTQREITNLLYLVLDISVPELEKFTLAQRARTYGKIIQREYNVPLVKVPQTWSLLPPCKSEKKLDGYIRGYTESFLSGKGVPLEFMEQINELTEGQEADPAYVEYEIDDLRQLVYLEALTMIQAGTMVKRCKRCGKYFIVTNRNVAYCDRIDESGLRCSVVGPGESFQKKMEADEALQIYNRAYKTHHARVRKGTMSQENFDEWRKNAKIKLEQTRTGELDIASFQVWLKK